jgi:hypothetical protein
VPWEIKLEFAQRHDKPEALFFCSYSVVFSIFPRTPRLSKTRKKRPGLQERLRRRRLELFVANYGTPKLTGPANITTGDGLGVNVSLSLAPENGFVFTWNGCLGLYDLNYGSVAFTNGTLKLQFKYPNNREGFEGIAPELLPVRWGGRHYLIAADRLIDFTNAINAGTEPSSLFGGRSGGFLLKRGDEEKPVSGQPTLPPQHMSYLLKEPIQASIARVDETRIEQTRRVTEVTINVGSTDGLKPGMELHVLKPSRVLDSALLTDVGEHSSRAIIEQGLSDPAPSVDWELSTKL